MNILIIGATGGTGRELVKQGVARGHNVTALARKPDRAKFNDSKVNVIQGNVLDLESLKRAMVGQDAVLSALGHKRWLGPTRILSEGTRNIITAMQVHGVNRFICETSLGVGDSFGRLGLLYTLFIIPVILPFYFWDKGRQEKVIRECSLNWTIVRPGPLNNFKGKKKYNVGPKVGNYIWTLGISRADVADFMLNQLTDETYVRKTPGCVGRIFT